MRRLPNPDISDFCKRLQDAQAEQAEALPHWMVLLGEYEGAPRYAGEDPIDAAAAAMSDGSDRPWVNYVLSTANTIVPALIAREPRIVALPTRPEFAPKAKAQEAAGSALAKKAGLLTAVQEVVLDQMLFGVGIIKVGWDSEDTGSLATPDYEDGEEGQAEDEPLDGLTSARAADVRRVLEEAALPVRGVQRLPFVRRVAPWNLLIAAGAANPAESPWVAERILMSDDDLRGVSFFRLPDGAAPDTVLSSRPSGPQQAGRDPTHHTVWEIRYWHYGPRGRSRRTLWIKAPPNSFEGVAVLAHIVDPVKSPGWPYEYIQGVGVAGTWYRTHTADLAAIRELANRLNEEWHYILGHHRLSSRRKYLFGPGTDEEKLAEWLESEDDMVGLQVNSDDVRNAVAILPEAPPPENTADVLLGLRSLIYEVGGIDAFQRGALPSDTTATAANIANQSTQARLVYRLAKVEELYAKAVRRILSYFQEFGQGELLVRVAGAHGPEFFGYLPGTAAYADFEVQIEAGSTMPRDPRSQQQNFLMLLQAIQMTSAAIVPAIQAGAMPPEALTGFIERAFDLWREDPGFYEGPMGQLAATIAPGKAQGQPASQPQQGPAAGPKPPSGGTPEGAY